MRRLALAVSCVLALLAAPASAAPPNNIVFVLTDDLSWDLVRHMPAVRQLQRDGTTFSRYIVSDSLCCPSRASIFTGRLPHNTHVETNVAPLGGYQQFLAAGNASSTFATTLRAAGYQTALMGKFLNGYQVERDPPLAGFSEWDAVSDGYRQYDYLLNHNGTPVAYGDGPESFHNTVLTRDGEGFIGARAADRKPFVLEVSSFTPHAPFVAAPEDAGRFPLLHVSRTGAFAKANRRAPAWLAGLPPLSRRQKRRMDGIVGMRARAVQSVDRMVAALRARLEATGLARSTYIVFTSDNGFHTGEHRLLAGKRTAFDHDIRVPLIVAGPGVPAGATTDVLAQNTDLRPTFEALAGRPPSTDVDGLSLVPWLRTPALGGGRGAALVEHVHTVAPLFADPDAQRRSAGNPPSYTALRLPDATYVEYATGGREFYDLSTDPDERANVFGDLSLRHRERLAARLAALRVCVGAPACAGP
ncbi:MAG: sulfatase family protein [Solirubrobacteraceae bacterium]